MLDVVYLVVTVALFAVVALVAKGVEKLVAPAAGARGSSSRGDRE